MKSKLNRIRTIAAAAALSAAVSFATPAFGLVSLAATGTVTGSDINVRSEASSSSSQVGTVTTGDTVTVGETATDDSGATWYQVTLSNGTTGYVRGDFLTVSEDETSSEEASTEETEASTRQPPKLRMRQQRMPRRQQSRIPADIRWCLLPMRMGRTPIICMTTMPVRE